VQSWPLTFCVVLTILPACSLERAVAGVPGDATVMGSDAHVDFDASLGRDAHAADDAAPGPPIDAWSPMPDAVAPAPDAYSPPDAHSEPDAALPSCDSTFGSATSYSACPTTTGVCTFAARLGGGSCATLCGSHMCLHEFGSSGTGGCTQGTEETCSTTHSGTHVCVCAQ